MARTINNSAIDDSSVPACCKIEGGKVLCMNKKCTVAKCYFRDYVPGSIYNPRDKTYYY